MNTHTETKHTPGPLEATERHDRDWEISKDGDVLATVHGDDSDPLCWPAGANAKLFAAAPELLEQLAKAADQLEVAARDLQVLNDGLNHYVRQPIPSVMGLHQLLTLSGKVSNNCERVAVPARAAIAEATGGAL